MQDLMLLWLNWGQSSALNLNVFLKSRRLLLPEVGVTNGASKTMGLAKFSLKFMGLAALFF